MSLSAGLDHTPPVALLPLAMAVAEELPVSAEQWSNPRLENFRKACFPKEEHTTHIASRVELVSGSVGAGRIQSALWTNSEHQIIFTDYGDR